MKRRQQNSVSSWVAGRRGGRQNRPTPHPLPPFDFSHRTMWRFCWTWYVFMAGEHRRSCTLNDRVWPISRISFKFRATIFALLSLFLAYWPRPVRLEPGDVYLPSCSIRYWATSSSFCEQDHMAPQAPAPFSHPVWKLKGIQKYLAHAALTLSLMTPGNKTSAIFDVWVPKHTLNCENLQPHWLVPKLCLFSILCILLLAQSLCPQ